MRKAFLLISVFTLCFVNSALAANPKQVNCSNFVFGGPSQESGNSIGLNRNENGTYTAYIQQMKNFGKDGIERSEVIGLKCAFLENDARVFNCTGGTKTTPQWVSSIRHTSVGVGTDEVPFSNDIVRVEIYKAGPMPVQFNFDINNCASNP